MVEEWIQLDAFLCSDSSSISAGHLNIGKDRRSNIDSSRESNSIDSGLDFTEY